MKVILSWSGGKDSALALYKLQKMKRVEVTGLLTTISREFQRSSIHGIRKDLLQRQAAAIGLEIIIVELPTECSNQDYERIMAQTMKELVSSGVEAVAFGDIFLEDVRQYRLKNLEAAGVKGLFPLWKRKSVDVAKEFIGLGFRSRIIAVSKRFPLKDLIGHEFNFDFLQSLPAEVDPCGENGEFHTFVYAGPIFKNQLIFQSGQVKEQPNDYLYLDLS